MNRGVAAGLVWPEPAEDAEREADGADADGSAEEAPEEAAGDVPAETTTGDDGAPAAPPGESPDAPPAEEGEEGEGEPDIEGEPAADAEGEAEAAPAAAEDAPAEADGAEDPDAEPEIVRPYSLPRDFDMYMLCACTVGYPSGAIDMACRAALTPARVARLVKAGEELTVDELLDKIQLLDKVSELDEAKMKDWTSKLPARVKLEKALKKEANGGEEEAPAKKKK